jgi:hypothetical protein
MIGFLLWKLRRIEASVGAMNTYPITTSTPAGHEQFTEVARPVTYELPETRG